MNIQSRLNKLEREVLPPPCPLPKAWHDKYLAFFNKDIQPTKEMLRNRFALLTALSKDELIALLKWFDKVVSDEAREEARRTYDEEKEAAQAGMTLEDLWAMKHEVCLEVTGEFFLDRYTCVYGKERAFFQKLQSEVL